MNKTKTGDILWKRKSKEVERRVIPFWVVIDKSLRSIGVTQCGGLKCNSAGTTAIFTTRKLARIARKAVIDEYPDCGAKVLKAELSFDWKG